MEITSQSAIAFQPPRTAQTADRTGHDANPATPASAAPSDAAAPVASSPVGAPLGALPLQMYAIPDWRADYGFQVARELGSSANWFAEQYPQAAAATQAERTEYGQLVESHYQALLKDHGIEDAADHYQATIADTQQSEQLRLEMAERVKNDPRLVDLMNLLGKSDLL